MFKIAARFFLALVLLGGGLGLTGCGENGDSGEPAAGAKLIESVTPRIESYVEATMADWNVPAVAIGIVADDRLVYSRGFGEREDGSKPDAGTLFEIGSSSKAFLGATEAQMVDRGKLDWNDRVIDHYPRFRMKDPWVTREFRIVDLLAQRTGLSDSGNVLYNTFVFPPEQAISALAEMEPATSFRSEFSYQNVPHLVASEIVAAKAGTRDWNEAVRKLILEPLGMDSSLAARDALTTSGNTTRGHQLTPQGEVRKLALGEFPTIAQGAGSIVSNVEDMAQWLRLQINEGEIDGQRVISREQIRATRRPRITVEGPMEETVRHGSDPASVQYATGWFVHSLPEGRIIEHGGNTFGYGVAVRFDPDRKLGLVVLTNLNRGDGAGGYSNPVAKYAMDLLQGREPLDYARIGQEAEAETPDQEAELPAGSERDLDEYPGHYAHPSMGTIRVERRGDGLIYTVGPDEVLVSLERVSHDDFIQSLNLENNPDGPAFEFPVEFGGPPEGPVRYLDVAGDKFTAVD